jgi:hypothetical protein
MSFDFTACHLRFVARAVRGRGRHVGHGLWPVGNVAIGVSSQGHDAHGRYGIGNAQGDSKLLRGRTQTQTTLTTLYKLNLYTHL